MKILIWFLIIFFGLWAVYGLILLISALLVKKDKIYEKHSNYYRKLLNSATWVVRLACNIRMRTSGFEKLPKDSRFLLVCNHVSNFDPLMTYLVMRKYKLSFLSKPENFNIPIFGPIIKRCCFLPIDREDPKKAMRSLLKAAEIMKDDQVSYGVYPEGTRSKGQGIQPFHNGVVKIAQKAGTPIVIAAITGVENVHKNAPLKKTIVHLDILKVIPADEVKARRSADLGDEAYELIKKFTEGDENEAKHII